MNEEFLLPSSALESMISLISKSAMLALICEIINSGKWLSEHLPQEDEFSVFLVTDNINSGSKAGIFHPFYR